MRSILDKKGGVVGDLISGTGGLIVMTIVILVIVSTLLGASLLTTNSEYDNASDRMASNFTQGIDNVSSKIPTDSNNLIDCSCCITFRCNRIVSKTSWCNGYRYWRSFIVN